VTLSFIVSKIRLWNRYRASLRELSQLSDRQLADIGLHRSSIEQAAWTAAAI
jgi:uncharacterized protein YjiS (DUF1127 family)